MALLLFKRGIRMSKEITDYLSELPTSTIIEHLTDRFDNPGEGFVYGYYTFTDADFKSRQAGHAIGGVGNHALQLGLAQLMSTWISSQNEAEFEYECDEDGEDFEGSASDVDDEK